MPPIASTVVVRVSDDALEFDRTFKANEVFADWRKGNDCAAVPSHQYYCRCKWREWLL